MEAIDQKYAITQWCFSRLWRLTYGQHWHRAIINRLQLCRPHPFDSRSRKAQAVIICCPSPSLKLSRWYIAAWSRFIYSHAWCSRKAWCDIRRCWGLGYAEAGDSGSCGAAVDAFRPLQANRWVHGIFTCQGFIEDKQASTHPAVSFSTVLPALARLCWSKRWPTAQRQISSASWAQSLCKST